MKRLYCVIYAFMSEILGLAGYAKEVFAAIFGFWYSAGKAPVIASLSTLQCITGATRASVVAAIKDLTDKGLISVQRSPGKNSLYEVTLEPELLVDYEATFRQSEVQYPNQQRYNLNTTTGSLAKPHAGQMTIPATGTAVVPQTKGLENNDVNIIRTSNNSLIDTGGLPEAK